MGPNKLADVKSGPIDCVWFYHFTWFSRHVIVERCAIFIALIVFIAPVSSINSTSESMSLKTKVIMNESAEQLIMGMHYEQWRWISTGIYLKSIHRISLFSWRVPFFGNNNSLFGSYFGPFVTRSLQNCLERWLTVCLMCVYYIRWKLILFGLYLFWFPPSLFTVNDMRFWLFQREQ